MKSPILIKHQAFTWFSKLKQHLFPDKPVPFESIYQTDIAKLQSLQITEQVYKDVRRLEAVVYSIDDYTYRLTQLLTALHGDTVFPLVTFELKLVKRCHFYLNAKGGYSNVHHLHQQFVETAIKVLHQHETVLSLSDRSVQLDTTLYRGQTLFNNLRALITQL